QGGGAGRRYPSAAGAQRQDERELRTTGEHQQRQRDGLRDGQPGRDRQRTEGQAVRAGGRADRESVAQHRPPRAGTRARPAGRRFPAHPIRSSTSGPAVGAAGATTTAPSAAARAASIRLASSVRSSKSVSPAATGSPGFLCSTTPAVAETGSS